MRRKDQEFANEEQIMDILRRCGVCRVALHDEPYPVTAHYCGEDAYEFDESLLERTAARKRTMHTVTAKALNKRGRDHSFLSS